MFDLPDLEFVTQRLLQNPADFAKVLKKFFGSKIAEQFEDLLREHLLIAAALVNAAKAGNAQEVEEQRRRWFDNAEDIARFFASISCFWHLINVKRCFLSTLG